MIGAALCRHSSHSASGSESAVIPPPDAQHRVAHRVELHRADRDVQLAAGDR